MSIIPMDIFKMPNDEFFRAIQEPILRKQVVEILENITDKMRHEVERLERYFDFMASHRQSLMTLAGLVSLIPIAIFGVDFLKYYLLWIFPYLVIVIITSAPSSYRTFFRFDSLPVASKLTNEGLMIMRAEADGWEDISKQLYDNFDKYRIWRLLNIIFVYTFLFSFIFQLYLFVFYHPLTTSINLLITACILVSDLIICIQMKRDSHAKNFESGIDLKKYDSTPTT